MVNYVLDVEPSAQAVPVDTFTEQHGLTLRVTQYLHCYHAAYDNTETKDGAMLTSQFGTGSTPMDAISDYLRRISRKRLIIDAWTARRREIAVPQLVLDPT